MPGYEIGRLHRLCYGPQPEYVAGHNKLAPDHSASRGATLPAAHTIESDRSPDLPKGNKECVRDCSPLPRSACWRPAAWLLVATTTVAATRAAAAAARAT